MASSFFEKSFKKVLHLIWIFVIIIKSANGGVAKWLNAAVCKTALSEFGGSNPPSSIIGISYKGSTSVSKTASVGSIPTIPVFNIMAELVKWLTHRFVDPACVGSIPTFRPNIGI